jgi:hypothetical protein
MEDSTMDKRMLRDVIGQVLSQEAGRLAETLTGLFETLVKSGEDPRQFEKSFRENLLGFGVGLLGKVMERFDPDLREWLRRRGHRTAEGSLCHGRLRSKGVKPVTFMTILGPVTTRRFTAVCDRCGTWVGTVDELLGVTPEHLTPGCASVAALAAATVSYAAAERHLLEMAGIRLDDKRIHRVVQRVGPSATRLLRADPDTLSAPQRLLPPPHRPLYAGVDGGRIRLRGGPWIEPCIGLIWWVGPDGHLRRWVIAEVRDKEHVLRVLDRWLARYKRFRRGKPILIADGAHWIWEWASKHPDAIWILDYYHLKEHVWAAAKTVYGEGTPKAAVWAKRMMNRLWRGQIRAAFAELDRLRPRGTGKRDLLLGLIGYIAKYEGMMGYRHHRSLGRTIGSGHVESMVKQLFSMRLKGPGMFWSEPGAQNVLHLRAAYIADRWDELWDDIHCRGLASALDPAA